MIDYSITLAAMRKNSVDDIAGILSGAAVLVAATQDRGLAGHNPAEVEREIAACFEELKAKLLSCGFLDAYKKNDGSIGWLI